MNDVLRVDETYIEIRRAWKFLYRAVDSQGNTLNFMPSAKRDGKATVRVFRKVLKAGHIQAPRIITVDKNAAYSSPIEVLKDDETIGEETELRQSRYLKAIIPNP